MDSGAPAPHIFGMTGNDYGHLAYLVLLLCVVGGWVFVSNRNVGQTLRQAAIWALIFAGVAGVAGFVQQSGMARPQQSVLAENVVEVPRGYDGHYRLTLEIDGTPVNFVVDTGASEMVLSREDAERVGIDTERLMYSGSASTANGIVGTASVRLANVTLGPIRDENVRALVNEGELFGSLLGMGYLQRFERIEIAEDRLVLTR